MPQLGAFDHVPRPAFLETSGSASRTVISSNHIQAAIAVE